MAHRPPAFLGLLLCSPPAEASAQTFRTPSADAWPEPEPAPEPGRLPSLRAAGPPSLRLERTAESQLETTLFLQFPFAAKPLLPPPPPSHSCRQPKSGDCQDGWGGRPGGGAYLRHLEPSLLHPLLCLLTCAPGGQSPTRPHDRAFRREACPILAIQKLGSSLTTAAC